LPDLIPTFWVEVHLVSSVAGEGVDEELPMVVRKGGGESNETWARCCESQTIKLS
jgi:hypothetical protein